MRIVDDVRVFGPRLAFRLRWANRRDVVASWIARHLPRKIVYFATIRLWAYATSPPWGDTIVPELEVGLALTRWELGPTHRPDVPL